jgi:hypothetical protein
LGFGDSSSGGQAEHLRRLWDAFATEFYTLVCTKDPKYNEVRQRIEALKGHPTSLVVAAVAGAVGATVGLSAGVVTPFVALLLHGILSLGTNTFCTYSKQTLSK